MCLNATGCAFCKRGGNKRCVMGKIVGWEGNCALDAGYRAVGRVLDKLDPP